MGAKYAGSGRGSKLIYPGRGEKEKGKNSFAPLLAVLAQSRQMVLLQKAHARL
jgi:hypothetical protein